MKSEKIFATAGDWALGADDLQWILYRRASQRTGKWRAITFVSTEKSILEERMRENGCVGTDAKTLLHGLPDSFRVWKNAPHTPLMAKPALMDGPKGLPTEQRDRLGGFEIGATGPAPV